MLVSVSQTIYFIITLLLDFFLQEHKRIQEAKPKYRPLDTRGQDPVDIYYLC